MGGFGAVKLALSHPNLFSFATGVSPSIDVPSRPFSVKRISQWRQHSSIFGPWGSEARHDRDPFVLARSVNSAQTPYLFLSCGEQEGLMAANLKFAELLGSRHFQDEFHPGPGGHDWNHWNQRLASVFQSRIDHSH
jgi:putative tributyrin esterase